MPFSPKALLIEVFYEKKTDVDLTVFAHETIGVDANYFAFLQCML